MAALFTAADLTTLTASVTAVLISFVVVNLIFVGNRYLKKAGVR